VSGSLVSSITVQIPGNYKPGDLYLNTQPVEVCPACGKPGVKTPGRGVWCYMHTFEFVYGTNERLEGQTCLVPKERNGVPAHLSPAVLSECPA